MTLTLEVLPAAHGDALIVTYGSPSQPHRILIDGGPAGTYAEGLRAHVQRLAPDERRFDLAIVTHIDTDHIDGTLKLFQDSELGLRIDDVWFNGWSQVSAASDGEGSDRGPLQGEFLSDLLTRQSWNTRFAGAAVVRDLDHPVVLPGGAELIVLSPTGTELERLGNEWTATLTKAGFAPGDSAGVAERLSQGRRYRPPDDDTARDRGGPADREPSRLGSDRAVANGSSIAVLLQFEGQRLLLGGDAHASVMTSALQGVTDRRGTTTVGIDVFKLPHHGSAGNLTPELLALVRCERYVVSTNGDHFQHPDREAIELLGRAGTGSKPTVYFNYASDTTRRWADATEQERVGIGAVFGTDGYLCIEA